VTQTTSNLCAQARRACCVGDHAECAEQGAGPCAWCKTMGHCSVLGCWTSAGMMACELRWWLT
jgi:hypothetical protein